MPGISWLAEDVLASLEEICSMESVSQFSCPKGHSVVVYVSFPVLSSLLPFLVLEGSSYARCDQSRCSSFVLLNVGRIDVSEFYKYSLQCEWRMEILTDQLVQRTQLYLSFYNELRFDTYIHNYRTVQHTGFSLYNLHNITAHSVTYISGAYAHLMLTDSYINVGKWTEWQHETKYRANIMNIFTRCQVLSAESVANEKEPWEMVLKRNSKGNVKSQVLKPLHYQGMQRHAN